MFQQQSDGRRENEGFLWAVCFVKEEKIFFLMANLLKFILAIGSGFNLLSFS